MKIVSVNVGLPRVVQWQGESVSTGIFKYPIKGRVALRKLNLDGDRQADLTVHGGPYKAVYGYPVEHYSYWKTQLPSVDFPVGAFGENFTIEGLNEQTLNIGDQYSVGTSLLMVTQPRMPCYKLIVKFGRADMAKRFHVSRLSGFYFSVLEEGEVGAGDKLKLVKRDEHNVSISNINELYYSKRTDPEKLRRAIEVEALPESWKGYFEEEIQKLTKQSQAAL